MEEKANKTQKYLNFAQLTYYILISLIAIINSGILILFYKYYEYKKIFIIIILIFLLISIYFIIKFIFIKQHKKLVYSILLFTFTLTILVILIFNPFSELTYLKIYGFYDISNGKIVKSFYGQKMAADIKNEIESLYSKKILTKKIFIEKFNKLKLSDLNTTILETLNRDLIEKIIIRDDINVYAMVGFLEDNKLKEIIFTFNENNFGHNKNESEREKKLLNTVLNKIINSNFDENKKIELVSNMIFVYLNSSLISLAYNQIGENETSFYISTLLKILNKIKDECPLIKNEINYLSAHILAVKNNFYLKNKQYKELALNIIEVIKLSKYYPYLSKEEFYKSYIQNYFCECERNLQELDNNAEKKIDMNISNFYDELGFAFANMPYDDILEILDKNYKELIKLYNNEPILFLYWGDYFKIHHNLVLLPKEKLKLIDKIEEKYQAATKHISLRKDDLLTTIINIKIAYLYLIKATKTQDPKILNKYLKNIDQNLKNARNATELLSKSKNSNSIASIEDYKKIKLIQRLLERASKDLAKDRYREH